VEESEAIVNEQTLKRFDIGGGEPSKALGEVISMDGKTLTIVGVVEDFHYETLEEKIEPMVFRYFHYGTNGYVNAKIVTKNLPRAMSGIEEAWRKLTRFIHWRRPFMKTRLKRLTTSFR
jgi:hypothetical protein